MKTVLSASPEETAKLACLLGKSLKGKEVIALFGGLGMGKTTFVKGLAGGMELDAEVSSPTFALVHEYKGKIPLYHFDMYRVQTYYDLCSTGFFDFLETNGVICIEWSENIEEELPKNSIRILFKHGKVDTERIITLTGDEYYENSWD
ncbi:MAG: tRNA (adenosine(37)-N6)-threonylcarbamoyltransferase complex ATPase subunit type 1 TsaE [Acutalibacteraceae bacterium]